MSNRNIFDEEFLNELRDRIKENDSPTFQQEERKRIISFDRIPKKLLPEIKYWKQLGFYLYNIDGDAVFYQAILPEGWYMQENGNSLRGIDIFDEKARIRGRIYYKASDFNPEAYAWLNPRYKLCEHFDYNKCMEEIYFGNKQEVLFFAGAIPKYNSVPEKIRPAIKEAKKLLIKAVNKYAEKHYPYWEDVMAYWGCFTSSREKLGKEIYFGNEQEVVFSAGAVNYEGRAPYVSEKELEAAADQLKKAVDVFAEEYLNLENGQSFKENDYMKRSRIYKG